MLETEKSLRRAIEYDSIPKGGVLLEHALISLSRTDGSWGMRLVRRLYKSAGPHADGADDDPVLQR